MLSANTPAITPANIKTSITFTLNDGKTIQVDKLYDANKAIVTHYFQNSDEAIAFTSCMAKHKFFDFEKTLTEAICDPENYSAQFAIKYPLHVSVFLENHTNNLEKKENSFAFEDLLPKVDPDSIPPAPERTEQIVTTPLLTEAQTEVYLSIAGLFIQNYESLKEDFETILPMSHFITFKLKKTGDFIILKQIEKPIENSTTLATLRDPAAMRNEVALASPKTEVEIVEEGIKVNSAEFLEVALAGLKDLITRVPAENKEEKKSVDDVAIFQQTIEALQEGVATQFALPDSAVLTIKKEGEFILFQSIMVPPTVGTGMIIDDLSKLKLMADKLGETFLTTQPEITIQKDGVQIKKEPFMQAFSELIKDLQLPLHLRRSVRRETSEPMPAPSIPVDFSGSHTEFVDHSMANISDNTSEFYNHIIATDKGEFIHTEIMEQSRDKSHLRFETQEDANNVLRYLRENQIATYIIVITDSIVRTKSQLKNQNPFIIRLTADELQVLKIYQESMGSSLPDQKFESKDSFMRATGSLTKSNSNSTSSTAIPTMAPKAMPVPSAVTHTLPNALPAEIKQNTVESKEEDGVTLFLENIESLKEGVFTTVPFSDESVITLKKEGDSIYVKAMGSRNNPSDKMTNLIDLITGLKTIAETFSTDQITLTLLEDSIKLDKKQCLNIFSQVIQESKRPKEMRRKIVRPMQSTDLHPESTTSTTDTPAVSLHIINTDEGAAIRTQIAEFQRNDPLLRFTNLADANAIVRYLKNNNIGTYFSITSEPIAGITATPFCIRLTRDALQLLQIFQESLSIHTQMEFKKSDLPTHSTAPLTKSNSNSNGKANNAIEIPKAIFNTLPTATPVPVSIAPKSSSITELYGTPSSVSSALAETKTAEMQFSSMSNEELAKVCMTDAQEMENLAQEATQRFAQNPNDSDLQTFMNQLPHSGVIHINSAPTLQPATQDEIQIVPLITAPAPVSPLRRVSEAALLGRSLNSVIGGTTSTNPGSAPLDAEINEHYYVEDLTNPTNTGPK